MGDLERISMRHSLGEEIFMFVDREGEQRKVDKLCPACLIPEKQGLSLSRLTLPRRGEWEL